MKIVFTDLDGTLLDPQTYAWEAARPALEELKSRGVPCVPVTSKTRAEVEYWRRALSIGGPFIVENGGAAYVPEGWFPFRIPGAASRDGYEVLEWGTPYPLLAAALDESAQSAGCDVEGFHHMDARAVSQICGIPLEQAVLARQREYDEPFCILDPALARRLLAELEGRGLHWTEGGRFHHVLGANDKAVAVQAVARWFSRLHDQVTTVGLGDAPNDAGFLEAVDIPVVVRSRASSALLDRLPHAWLTAHAGPRGWNDAILALLRAGDARRST